MSLLARKSILSFSLLCIPLPSNSSVGGGLQMEESFEESIQKMDLDNLARELLQKPHLASKQTEEGWSEDNLDPIKNYIIGGLKTMRTVKIDDEDKLEVYIYDSERGKQNNLHCFYVPSNYRLILLKREIDKKKIDKKIEKKKKRCTEEYLLRITAIKVKEGKCFYTLPLNYLPLQDIAKRGYGYLYLEKGISINISGYNYKCTPPKYDRFSFTILKTQTIAKGLEEINDWIDDEEQNMLNFPFYKTYVGKDIKTHKLVIDNDRKIKDWIDRVNHPSEAPFPLCLRIVNPKKDAKEDFEYMNPTTKKQFATPWAQFCFKVVLFSIGISSILLFVLHKKGDEDDEEIESEE